MWRYLILLVCFDTTRAYLQCCNEPNTLGRGRCSDGNQTILRCPKFLVEASAEPNGTFTIVEDYLQLEASAIPPHKYCLTLKGSKEVALICAEENVPTFWSSRVICLWISVFFLVLTISVYLIVPELRDLQGECTLNSIVGLAFSFITLAIALSVPYLSDVPCVAIAVCIYFAFIYCFFWLNCLAIHIWRTVVQPKLLGSERQWRIFYYMYGLGAPISLLIVLLITQHVPGNHIAPKLGEAKCWFYDMKATFAYFYGPIAILLLTNLVLFMWTSIRLWYNLPQHNSNKIRTMRYKLSLYIKLFFIMGLSWIFEVLSAAFDKDENMQIFWNITDYINIFQGILIFLLLVVTRKRALKGLANRRICCITFPSGWKTMEDEENEDEDVEEMRLSQCHNGDPKD